MAACGSREPAPWGEVGMSERMLTLHPAGKTGVNISRDKYDRVRAAILAAVRERGTLPFGELAGRVGETLGDGFDGSIGWYTTTVKLDLEARGEIERVPHVSPQQLRLAGQARNR